MSLYNLSNSRRFRLRLLEPFLHLERFRDLRLSSTKSDLRNCGLSISIPSLIVIYFFNPKSIPTDAPSCVFPYLSTSLSMHRIIKYSPNWLLFIVSRLIFPLYSRLSENLYFFLSLFTTSSLPFREYPPCLKTIEQKSTTFLNFGGRFAKWLKNLRYAISRRCIISCTLCECNNENLYRLLKCFCILLAETYL